MGWSRALVWNRVPSSQAWSTGSRASAPPALGEGGGAPLKQKLPCQQVLQPGGESRAGAPLECQPGPWQAHL